MSRKQGRPEAPLPSGAQRSPQVEFAALLRTEFFDRLEQLGIRTADITKALGEGFSGATLSRFRKGERVPDRDKLYRLLAYVEEIAGQPLPDEARDHVLERYYTALKATNEPLYKQYLLLDERDESLRERDRAVEEQEQLRAQLVRCEEDLAGSRLRLAAVEREAEQAASEARALRSGEQAAEDEISRLTDLHEELSRSARQARQRQQTAQREVERLHDLLMQQDLQHARAENALTQENAQLRDDLQSALARADDQAEQSQRTREELESVRQQLREAEDRNRQLVDSNAVVLRSRTQLSGLLANARHQEKSARKRLEAAQKQVAALETHRLSAERKVADAEERLIAAYRSRDALLERPEAPGAAVKAAEQVVDGAWEALGEEIERIERKTSVVPSEETKPSSPDDQPRRPKAPVQAPPVSKAHLTTPREVPAPRAVHLQGAHTASGRIGEDGGATAKRNPPTSQRTGRGDSRPKKGGSRPSVHPPPCPAPQEEAEPRRFKRGEVVAGIALTLGSVSFVVGVGAVLAWLFPDGSAKDATDVMEEKARAKWTVQLSRPLYGQPAVTNGVIAVPAYYGAIYGIDATSGKKLWEEKTKDYGNGRVAVAGNIIVFANDAYLQSIDARTGKAGWKYRTMVNATVTANKTTVFSAWGSFTEAHRASDGKKLWEYTFGDDWDGIYNRSPETTATEDTFYLQGKDGDLRTIDIATGKPGWKKKLGAPSARIGVSHVSGKLIVATTDAIMALDAKTGKELWKSTQRMTGISAVSDGRNLYYETYDNTYHYLWAVDVNTGKEKWHNTYALSENNMNPEGRITASSERLYYRDGNYSLVSLDSATGKALPNHSQENNAISFLLATESGVYTSGYNQAFSYFPTKAFR
ncbi:outer membrane protein assembly factor BamB [Streptomyces sp. PanSC9]|nr:outer membrane protein assembly factor BamB [Streptomyces sp. PanSC9]